MKKFVLGTVKLGLPDYGFSSRPADPDFDAQAFLDGARNLGVEAFDTSPRYGEAEAVLGRHIRSAGRPAFLSSKIDELRAGDPSTVEKMFRSVERSLERLHVDVLDLCYVHQNEIEILSDPHVLEGFARLKEKGLILKAGASPYDVGEVEYAAQSPSYDVVQAAVSVFDLTLLERFEATASPATRFAGRSLFLQGILTHRETLKSLHPRGAEMLTYMERLDALARREGVSVGELAVAFVNSLDGVDRFIVGTTSLENLEANLASAELTLSEGTMTSLTEMASTPKPWTNPRTWNSR